MPKLFEKLDLERCPHCKVDRPNLQNLHAFPTNSFSGDNERHWRVYKCSRCGGVVIAASKEPDGDVTEIYPASARIDESLPSKARVYLSQALNSLHAPAGAAMLASSAVDAMLKEKGYKVGLICNTGTTPGKTIRVLLERFGMLEYFDVTIFSNELKIRKPDPRIFLHTLAQLKSQPQSSVHVGDLIDTDVWGAKNVGMVAVHFNPDLIPCEEIDPDFAIRQLKELSWILSDPK